MSRNNGSPAGACHRAAIRPTRWRATTAESVAYSYSSDTASRSHGAMRPSCAFIFRPLEGVGNAGCPLHPRSRVHLVVVERTRVTTSTPERPAFPHAMVLTAYVVLSPVTGLFCHRRQRIWFCLSPVGPTQLRELDASVGASGPHDFAVRSNISRRRAVDRSRIQRTRPAIPSRAKRCRVHRIPCPTSVTIAIRPSVWDGMTRLIEMFLPTTEAKYFCKEGWTALSTIRPTGKSPHGGESKFRSCPGRGAARRMG